MKQLWMVFMLVMCSLTATADGLDSIDVAILGDSNSWIGGDDCSKAEGWNHWFVALLQPRSCRSYARSGATWTNTPQTRRNTRENIAVLGNDNVIYNQVCRLTEAVDSGVQPVPQLVLILAGTNDAWFVSKRPEALKQSARDAYREPLEMLLGRQPREVLTLAASVRYCCGLLSKRFPGVRIVLLTPPQSVQAGARIATVAQLIADCGQEGGLQVVRLDGSKLIDSKVEQRQKRFTKDGTHTNVTGARRIGQFVAEKINSKR